VQISANNRPLLHFSIVVLTSAESCSLFPCGRSRGPPSSLSAGLSIPVRATEQGFSPQLVSIIQSLPTQLSRPVHRSYNCPPAFNCQFRSLQSSPYKSQSLRHTNSSCCALKTPQCRLRLRLLRQHRYHPWTETTVPRVIPPWLLTPHIPPLNEAPSSIILLVTPQFLPMTGTVNSHRRKANVLPNREHVRCQDVIDMKLMNRQISKRSRPEDHR
jgi:hypothetical protein